MIAITFASTFGHAVQAELPGPYRPRGPRWPKKRNVLQVVGARRLFLATSRNEEGPGTFDPGERPRRGRSGAAGVRGVAPRRRRCLPLVSHLRRHRQWKRVERPSGELISGSSAGRVRRSRGEGGVSHYRPCGRIITRWPCAMRCAHWTESKTSSRRRWSAARPWSTTRRESSRTSGRESRLRRLSGRRRRGRRGEPARRPVFVVR